MDDLDTALRAMMRERARDISSLPPALSHLIDDAAATGVRRRHPGWLVAAAVVGVLLVVGVATLVTHRPLPDRRSTGVGGTSTPRPTASPTPHPTPNTTAARLPTSLPPTAHAARAAALTSIAMRPLPGYALRVRTSQPGYRSVAVRASADHGVPVGCNGCEIATAYVDVVDRDRFDPAKYGVLSWTRTTVGGRPAYRGQMSLLGAPAHRVPTLAWQFGPGRWALVQGVTGYGGTAAHLATVAAAVEPDAGAPVGVPFRLTWVPALPVESLVDDRSEGYALEITLGHNDGSRANDPQIDLTLWPHSDPHTVAHTASHRVVVDHVTGWYDRAQGVADIPVGRGVLEVGISDTASLSAADRVMLDRLLAGLRLASAAIPFDADAAVP